MNLKNLFFMFNTWLGVLSCTSEESKSPIFPLTDNANLQVSKLALPANQIAISYIVSKDKKQVLVYTIEHENDNSHHPGVGSHLLVFGQDGTFVKDILLNLNMNTTSYDLFYTTTGLLTMSNASAYLYFIDTQNDGVKSWRIYNLANNPNQATLAEQAKTESQAWEQSAIEKLNGDYQLNENEVNVENKKIPDDYWVKYRAIKSETENRAYQTQTQLYGRYLSSLIPANTTLNGLKRGNLTYLMLRDNENEGLFQIENEPSQNVNWLHIQKNSGVDCTGVTNQLNWKNDQMQDAQNVMTCLQKTKTSSYKDDLIGKMTTDYRIKLEIGNKTATCKLKDRPFKLGDDGFFTLQNGAIVAMHKNTIYLIH